MPQILLNNDRVQVVIKQRLNGSAILNVLHYRAEVPVEVTTNDGEAVLFDLITNLRAPAGLLAKMKANQTTDLGYDSLTAQVVGPIRKPYVRTTFNEFGDLDPPTMPTGVDAVITKRSTVAGRGRSGSFHLGGIANDAVIDSNLTPAARTDLIDVASAVKETIGVAVIDPVGIINFVPILVSDPVLDIGNDVLDAFVQQSVRYMTRRTLGRGI